MAKRGEFQPSPDYDAIGQNSLFTLKIYHGGIMREYPVRNYSGGQFDFFDRVDGDEFGLIELKDFVGQLGYDKEKVRFWHQFGSSLHMGSRVLETDSDVYEIVEQTKWKREQEIYLEHIVDLPSVHESEPDIQPSNIEYSNLNTDFEPVIDFSFLDNVPESPKNLNASSSSQSSESKNLNASSASSSSQSSESLFYSDTEYDMDEDDREFEKYVDHNVEWDGEIGKGKNVQTDDRINREGK
ncbi:hypothetical protein DH2020_024349 [Rehmannia glutinosa]|uniref:PB1-like domain-containing protein n=1 Tax=Rehmannia glutinosa TaxID=99300 RepID=A0ABR0W2L6_REHGL